LARTIPLRRLLLSAKEVITSDALIFYPQKRRKRRRYGMNSYNIGLEDRKIIEEMYNAGAKPCEIAARIGKCQATIYREIKRGEVPELNARCRPAYRAEVAEKRVTEAYRKRGRRKATE
jgi:IS30 family transposase